MQGYNFIIIVINVVFIITVAMSLGRACNQPENLLEEIIDSHLKLHMQTSTIFLVPFLVFLEPDCQMALCFH